MVRFYSCFISVWKLRRLSALYLKAKYFQIRAWYKISAAQHFLCHICYVLVLGMSGTVQNMVRQRLAKVCRAAYVAPKPTHIIKVPLKICKLSMHRYQLWHRMVRLSTWPQCLLNEPWTGVSWWRLDLSAWWIFNFIFVDAPLRVSQVFLSPCRDFNCSIAALLNFCLVYRDFSEMMNSSISFQFDVEENYFQIIKQIALVISHSVEPLLIFASKVLLSGVLSV